MAFDLANYQSGGPWGMAWPGCCCEACFVETDLFSRAESTDPGDWYERVGDWGINASSELVEDWSTGNSGSAGAIAIHTVPVPNRSAGEMYVQIEVPIAALDDNDVYRLYPCCSKNLPTDPYLYGIGPVTATYTFLGDYLADGHDYWQIDISSSGSSADPVISQQLTGGTHVLLYVCADHEIGGVRAGIWPSENQLANWLEVDPGTGTYAGLGHNNAAKLNRFDNFELGELRTSTEVCENCFCMCDLTPMPLHLTGTFMYTSSAGGTRMSCLAGISFALDFAPNPALSSPVWTGETTVTTATSPPVDQTVRFTLVCDGSFSLSITVYEGETEVEASCFRSDYYGGFPSATAVPARWADDDPAPDYASSCDPISLVYGPWDVAAGVDLHCDWCYERLTPLIPCLINPDGPIGGPECQGQFWIVITE